MYYNAIQDDEDVESFKKDCLKTPDFSSFNFMMPPMGIHPKEFVSTHFGHGAPRGVQFKKGTTTLAFVYEPKTENDKGGIIVAVDSRASSGEYISSSTVNKILDISDRMVATMAGGAADCQFWTRVVAKYCNMYELREKTEITVSAAAKYFANVLYGYRGYGLSVGSMVAGYDKRGYSIFSVNSEGERQQQKICSVGSGSLAAYGILDTFYQPKMTDEEAFKLGQRAIMHATFRDSGSGGVCNLVHITSTGKTRYPPVDVSKLFYEFKEELGQDLAYEPKNDN
uniref:proteasome endopeptidase complex n=1 Tax=Acrobeloides nanus TaxID=290746 RepID=A0A914CJW8_9BILA